MQRRSSFMLALLLGAALMSVVVATSLVSGQENTSTPRLFERYTTIGEPRPIGLVYNPPFDQYALITLEGQLVLMDANTYTVQHVLKEADALVNAYQFSHNGKTLAVAVDVRLELWDTQTGLQIADVEPDGALSVQRPIYFSDDDQFIAFETVIRAPQAIRRSENDTSILPWLLDVGAATRLRGSNLPGRVIAQPFYENRGGLVLGPRNLLVASVVERLQLYKFNTETYTLATELVTRRTETSPLVIWQSLSDGGRNGYLYVKRDDTGSIVQVNTQDGSFVDLLTGSTLQAIATPIATPTGTPQPPEFIPSFEAVQGFMPTRQTHLIGQAHSRQMTSLGQFLLGEDYLAGYDYRPVTLMLLDILAPKTLLPDNYGFLVMLRDEGAARTQIRLIQDDIQQLVLSPDERQVLIRLRSTGELRLYDLHSGALVRTYMPSAQGLSIEHQLGFAPDGKTIVSDFQRIDIATGETLNDVGGFEANFETLYFTEDSTQLLTIRGGEWLKWDIASGQLLGRGTFTPAGSIIDISPNGERYLSQLDNADGIEIYNIITGERRQLLFENVAGRFVQGISPSPTWEYFLVTYSEITNATSDFTPAMAMYSLDEGKLWLIADADLLTLPNWSGWADHDTVYFASEQRGGFGERLYGVEYDASGLPACMVATFPDAVERYAAAWERVVARNNTDTVNRLALAICTVLQDGGDDTSVEALFNPTATPTPFIPTATPALVAGVPTCLTLNFPNQALDYAEDWRRITEGLTDEQIAEIESLLCESVGGSDFVAEGFTEPPLNVVLVEALTGVRSVGSFIPQTERIERSITVIDDAFFRVERRFLSNPVLSPDGRLVAEYNFDGTLQLWKINAPYEAFIDDVTATAQAGITEVKLISVRPTETAPFDFVGTARPTLTPTMTVSAPPPPQTLVEQELRGEGINFCPSLESGLGLLESTSDPAILSGWMIVPPLQDFSFGQPIPPTREPIFIPPTPLPALPTEAPSRTPSPVPTVTNTPSIEELPFAPPRFYNAMWWLNPRDGSLTIDERLPMCGVNYDCNYSFNREWMWYDNGVQVIVSRPDGRDARVLLDYTLNPVNYNYDYRWEGEDTLVYTVNLIERNPEVPNTYIQRLSMSDEAAMQATPIPTTLPIVRVNELITDILSYQPVTGQIVLARRMFDTEYRYYLVDTVTGEVDYFARDNLDFNYFWSPTGDKLFYQYTGLNAALTQVQAASQPTVTPPGSPQTELTPIGAEAYALTPNDIWYVYDTTTRTHAIYGNIPSGLWSPDGRYKVDWYYPPDYELRVLRENEQPFMKIRVWDSLTGQSWRYCVPNTGERSLDGRFLWSPDSRYVAFEVILDDYRQGEVSRPNLLVLDIATGKIYDLGFEVNFPVAWVAEREGE